MIASLPAPGVRSTAQSESLFFDDNEDTLYDLFTALGREDKWCDNPEALLPYTQAKWVGLDHGNSSEKDQFDPDQEAAAKDVLQRLGLQEQVLPPAGRYEQIVIIGGMMRVNRERIKFMKHLIETHEVQADQIVFWAGQRLRDNRDDAQVSAMDLKALSADEWVQDELSRPTKPGYRSRFATETELARLAYLEHFSHAELSRTNPATRPSLVDGIPDRNFASYTFTANGYPELTLMDCAAVERPAGPARHTTGSCATEWLEEVTLSDKAQVLVVAGNPHILRNIRDIRRATRQNERPDIELTVCGPAANPAASIQLYLGEVGRLLYMDAMVLREATDFSVEQL
jgi:hypothetical protein